MEFSREDQITAHLINLNLAIQDPHSKFNRYLAETNQKMNDLYSHLSACVNSLKGIIGTTQIKDSLDAILRNAQGLQDLEKDIFRKLEGFEKRTKENLAEVDLGQTLSEIKYIGNRLKAIEERLMNIEKSGVKSDVFVTVSQQERSIVVAEKEDKQVEILSTLTDRERTILVLRYGLAGESKTYAAIGKKVGISLERVRQIEHKALRRLRQRASMKLISEKDFPEGSLKTAILGKGE